MFLASGWLSGLGFLFLSPVAFCLALLSPLFAHQLKRGNFDMYIDVHGWFFSSPERICKGENSSRNRKLANHMKLKITGTYKCLTCIWTEVFEKNKNHSSGVCIHGCSSVQVFSYLKISQRTKMKRDQSDTETRDIPMVILQLNLLDNWIHKNTRIVNSYHRRCTTPSGQTMMTFGLRKIRCAHTIISQWPGTESPQLRVTRDL